MDREHEVEQFTAKLDKADERVESLKREVAARRLAALADPVTRLAIATTTKRTTAARTTGAARRVEAGKASLLIELNNRCSWATFSKSARK